MDFITVTAVITALVEVIKRAGVPGKFLPLVAVVFGVAYALFTHTAFHVDVVLYGVMLGLASVGLFEGVKVPVSTGVNQVKKLM